MNRTVKEIGKKMIGLIPSKIWLSYWFKRKFGRPINWKNPQTFNEKLQWLKVYDRNPLYTTLVDKYEVKKYVAEKIGEQYIIPTLGVWDSFDEIDFDSLPSQFVLKCTHDSGGLIIVRDKTKFDKTAARKMFRIALNRNPYSVTREWPYKNVKPRIIAEQYMEDAKTKILPVYKVFTFDGKPKLIQAIQNDKTKDETIDYFDTNWCRLELRQNFPNSTNPLPCPKKLEQMLTLVKQLAVVPTFLRVDFYEINGELYFSEFTFFSDSGLKKFHPEKWDRELGDLINLPNKK